MSTFSRQVTFWLAAALWTAFAYQCTQFVLHRAPEPYRTAGTYWASGDAANRHLDPYGNYPLTWHFQPTPDDNRTIVDLNLNPPVLLPLFQVMALLDPATMTRVYMAATMLLFVGGAWMLLRRRPGMQKRQILWIFFASPLFDTLTCTQIYALMFLVAVLAWGALEQNRRTAALWIGLLIAMKPIFVLWPVMLFLSGARRLATESAAAAAALSAAPVLMYGPAVYAQWAVALAHDPHWIYPSDLSVPANFTRAGWPHLGLAAGVALAVVLAWRVARTRPDPRRASVIGMCASMLVSPLAWAEYFLFLYPAMVAKPWNRVSGAAAALIAMPVVVMVALMRTHPRIAESMGLLETLSLVLLLLPGSGLGFPVEALRGGGPKPVALEGASLPEVPA